MLNRKRVKANQNLYKQIWKLSNAVIKGLIKWFLRSLLVIGRRARLSRAGFVLPTVAMVGLVVVLLTTAILVRSFDRSKNASNVRVNQVVLNAAAPAVDRAKAKIEDVLAKLAGKIPSDGDLNTYFNNNTNKTYTLGDETPLEVVFDFGNGQDASPGSSPPPPDGKIEFLANKSASRLENDETLTTAWKFPVDTDNNGLFDSYTLYGIYYRSPSSDTTSGNFNRPRNPLQARTPPMSGGTMSGQCPSATGTSASLVGSSSWFKTGANLAKSFFVYTATVPITSLASLSTNPPGGIAQYDIYKNNGIYQGNSNKGFSALEYQQDRIRIPLSNNAVVYNDDVELNPAPVFRLNGRLVTNSNLLVGNFGKGINFYQVSSTSSCYYQEENSKIVVGGNVAAGGILSGISEQYYQPSTVDLFQGAGKSPNQNQISTNQRSTTNLSPLVSYNTQAYTQRIARLVAAQSANPSSTDPSDVQKQVNPAAPASQQAQVRQTQLQTYFINRTRRVPSIEVPYGSNALMSNGIDYSTVSPLQGSGDILRPIDAWTYPTSPSDGITGTGYTGLTLNINTGQQQAQLQATEPQTEKQNGQEQFLGDRIQVGNNLPALWFNNGAFAGANTQQNLSNINWDANPATGPVRRYRQTRVQALADLGITDRDGFWEQAAAAQPTTQLDNNGGLRVVTGAGVYERKNSFLPTPYYDNPTSNAIEYSTTYDDPATPTVEQYPMVWPDSMPMSPGAQVSNNTSTPSQWTALQTPLPPAVGSITSPPTTIDPYTPQYAKGDLRMRATVVYHYAYSTYDPIKSPYQKPIACISSYYDPTNSLTARNPVGTPDVSGIVNVNGTPPPQPVIGVAKSNNGVVYPAPDITASSLTNISSSNAIGLFSGDQNSTTLQGRLSYQANLKFPNGRFVNELLRNALNAIASNQNLTLSQQSAIDSTICALRILDKTLSPSITPTTGVTIPHGAIQEISFLDARQIQAIDKDDLNTYPVETFTTDGNPNVTNGSANLTGNYDLSVEQRQPLEIRATMLDINSLRGQTITGSNVLASSEYLLPNTGIIYASRDDALPDLSDKTLNTDGTPNIQARQLLSPTDFKLDPTRRPHSILLTHGSNLSRSQSFQAAEKGLILATNLPVYVNGNPNFNDGNGNKNNGNFNLHTQQEFTNLLANDWGNFYNRTTSQINPNFACRQGDPRLPNCTQGDQWRSATVLADAVTLLSSSFNFGFRNDGDYDLRNNNGNRDSINKLLNNGFWSNNFVTSRNFKDSTYSGNTGGTNDDSSYFNNFVTPIQRRVQFPEYVMEICRKLPVSECQSNDWVVGFDMNGDGDLEDPVPLNSNFDANWDGVVDTYDTEKVVKASRLGQALVVAGNNNAGSDNILSGTEVQWSTPFGTGNKSPLQRLGSGTTAIPALVAADQRYARRVAFARNQSNSLVFTDIGTTPNFNETPQPLGVGCNLDANGTPSTTPQPQNSGCQYPGSPGSSTATAGTHYGNPTNNALWFRTTNSTSGQPFCNDNNDPVGGCTSNDKSSYANNRSLYYLSTAQNGNNLFLPPTPEIPGAPSLNLPTGNPASSYTVCTFQSTHGSSKLSFIFSNPNQNTPPELGSCATGTMNQIQAVLGYFINNLNPDVPNTNNIVRPTQQTGTSGTPPPVAATSTSFPVTTGPINTTGTTTTFTNNPPPFPQPGPIVNIIDINGDLNTASAYTTIKLVGDANSIFIFRKNSALNFVGGSGNRGVQLVLNGVDPNNVFWAINGSVKWNTVSQPHIMAGTFIIPSTVSTQWQSVVFQGGRFLGSNAISGFTNTQLYATGSTGQPSLVPVLQIQNTTNSAPPVTTLTNVAGTSQVTSTRWMPPATATTFNLVAATGDTPPRVNSSVYESNGGLHNFVRFLENWQDNIPANISGSFIQLKRSAYATAPWSSLLPGINVPGIFDDPYYPQNNYPQAYRDAYGLLGYPPIWGNLPHYVAPVRQWGFDVALLSQSPDLFAQKLTLAPTSPPNEFFREVGRDDPWIQALLCAAQKNGTGKSYAVDTDQLPSCPFNPSNPSSYP